MFAFTAVSVYDERTKPRFERKRRDKFKEVIGAELCLKLWLGRDWYFCNITESGWFSKRLSRKKVVNNDFLNSLQKQPYADVLQ